MQLSTLKLIFFLLLLSFFSHAQNLGGHPASLKWKQVDDANAKVIFTNGNDSQARRIHNIVSMLDTTTLYSIGNKSRKWNIVLLNQTTVHNAYVRLAPVISEFYMTPDQDNFSNGSLRWDDNLVIHENRHMQQFSNFNEGLTKVFSFFLGQEGQLLANGITIPNYFFEGDAVWQETLVSNQGRGRLPYFFNGMKSLWQSNKNYSWMKLRSGSLKDFVPDHYALGYPLVAYGYEKYGADFWRKVTQDAVHFKGLFYSFNRAIERYSGVSYRQFQQDALQHFKIKLLPAEDTAIETSKYITAVQKNNVTDYLYPAFVNDDTLLVTKKSYKEINSFYFIIKGKEEKIRVKDYVIDDYFSYNNGKIVYAAFQSDPRWTNRDYSVIQLLDIYTREQKQLSFKSKYFSPDINTAADEILAVQVNEDGSNFLHRLNASTGELIMQVPNPNNYFFTQTKYLNIHEAVSAVRHPDGKMALIKINLNSGQTELLTPFTNNVLGFPVVKNDTVYYSRMNNTQGGLTEKSKWLADRIFAVDIKTKNQFQLTDNITGIYQPAVNSKGQLVVSAFTADGSRLAQIEKNNLLWIPRQTATVYSAGIIGVQKALQQKGNSTLNLLKDSLLLIKPYKKSFHLFNFHSARPFVNDPEYGYQFYSNNILSTFSNDITYTYNRNEKSHAVGFNALYGGLYPFLNIGVEGVFNRNIDTALGKGIQFNSARLSAGLSFPFQFINGRTFKYLRFGAGYYIEQIPYIGIGKDIFANKAHNFINTFFSFTNQSRQAKQHINPRWAQTIFINYRDAFTFYKNHKLLATSSLYFPGIAANHSLVFNLAYQKRDLLPDLFSNNFPFSRGYEALNQRRMYKFGVNYHIPLLYPDWGIGNIFFIQRVRTNIFYDYGSALTKFVRGRLAEVKSRSTGTEIYFDTKIWNSLPVSIGFRYSRLLDMDLLNPTAVNRWEIIIPINLIPN